MDLTVFANGANRNVSGVTEATTCSQIVYVLAHATNQKGKFMLVAKFNGSVSGRFFKKKILYETEKRL